MPVKKEAETRMGKPQFISAMLVALAGGLLTTASGSARAESDGIDGETGELQVSGWLVEQPYGVQMHSAFQEVTLDNVIRGNLYKPGIEGEPMTFVLHLRDFLRATEQKNDTQRQARPLGLRVTFLGTADKTDPSLLAVSDTSGVGLKLRDTRGRQVKLSEPGEPQFVDYSADELVYTVTAVRTARPLIPGEFRAEVAFQMSYE